MTKHLVTAALAILVAGIGVSFLVLCIASSGAQPIVINGITAPPVPTLDSTRVAEGEALYVQNCASCHGRNLEGAANWKVPLADGSYRPPPHDSSGHTWHHKDELLIDIIQNGGNPKNNPPMPAFKEHLTHGQAVAVLEFLKSRWGRQEREFQWWTTAVGDQQ